MILIRRKMDKKIKIWHIILLIVILVFIFFLIRAFRVGGCSPTDAPINDTIVKSDTVYISKIDTIKVYYPKYIKVSTKDTIYISKDTTLEIKSKMYSEKDKYDIWISGIEPLALDSINVYREVKYETITNTITRDRYINQRQLFLGIYMVVLILVVALMYMAERYILNSGCHIRIRRIGYIRLILAILMERICLVEL